ncbi:MAG: c-type cytochrome [Sandaracinaceae bacterium]|nr:c-type cytochrome [Sandaracinaceae bacterium]
MRLVIAFTMLTASCAEPGAGTDSSAPSPAPLALRMPDRSTIPEGPLGDAIRRGEQLVTRTAEELPDHVGNDLHCTSCHLQGGTVAGAAPWVGITGVFPEHRSRSGRVVTIDRRINDCFERSMNGTALDPQSEEMAAIVAYMTWLSRDVPIGREVEGRGFRRAERPPTPDREAGRALYAERCAACHGEDGEGRRNPDGGYLFPALWGERSFNVGAGMARLHTAASFVRWNMPLGQGGTLTEQQAYDVADYFIHQDRPDFAGKASDWPHGGRPSDARF